MTKKQTVGAALQSAVKRLLMSKKPPPDQCKEAIKLALQRAELLATDWDA